MFFLVTNSWQTNQLPSYGSASPPSLSAGSALCKTSSIRPCAFPHSSSFLLIPIKYSHGARIYTLLLCFTSDSASFASMTGSIDLHHLSYVTTFIAHFLLSTANKVQRAFLNLFLPGVFCQALLSKHCISQQYRAVSDFMAEDAKEKSS